MLASWLVFITFFMISTLGGQMFSDSEMSSAKRQNDKAKEEIRGLLSNPKPTKLAVKMLLAVAVFLFWCYTITHAECYTKKEVMKVLKVKL